MHTKFLFRAFLAGSLIVPATFISMKQKNNQLWSWGFGKNGQLGLGSEANKSKPQPIKNINFVDIDAKKSISAGISIDGKLYTWGKNRSGIIGHHPPNLNVLLPREVEINDKVAHISCGYQNMCAVTQKGEVYVWGLESVRPKFRQIGTSEQSKQSKNSIQATKLDIKNIIETSCSSDYIAFLSSDGQVYQMGKSPILSSKGITSTSPSQIIALGLSSIKKVSSGLNYSIALDKDGRVFVWGNNTFGQLGTGSLKNQISPVMLDHFRDRIIDVSCGDNYTAVLTDKGEVYTWGYGNQGQLGHGDKSDQMYPRKIQNLNHKIVQISCGGGHTAMITSTNKLLMMGRGRQGQLGREQIDQSNSGYSLKIKEVQQLPTNKTISKVVCGGNHTMILIDNVI